MISVWPAQCPVIGDCFSNRFLAMTITSYRQPVRILLAERDLGSTVDTQGEVTHKEGDTQTIWYVCWEQTLVISPVIFTDLWLAFREQCSGHVFIQSDTDTDIHQTSPQWWRLRGASTSSTAGTRRSGQTMSLTRTLRRRSSACVPAWPVRIPAAAVGPGDSQPWYSASLSVIPVTSQRRQGNPDDKSSWHD